MSGPYMNVRVILSHTVSSAMATDDSTLESGVGRTENKLPGLAPPTPPETLTPDGRAEGDAPIKERECRCRRQIRMWCLGS